MSTTLYKKTQIIIIVIIMMKIYACHLIILHHGIYGATNRI